MLSLSIWFWETVSAKCFFHVFHSEFIFILDSQLFQLITALFLNSFIISDYKTRRAKCVEFIVIAGVGMEPIFLS